MTTDSTSLTMAGPPSTQPSLSCCTGFYEQDWVRRLAEDCFHPGGVDLTRRMVAQMQLPAAARVIDLGCGTGNSALLLAQELGYRLTGVDLSASNIRYADERARQSSVKNRLQFLVADSAVLPCTAAHFDAALCECTFSLFTDKAAVLAEIQRILRPGGQLGITDMTLGASLAPDLAAAVAPWACLSGALNEEGYRQLFARAGLQLQASVDESQGLISMLNTIRRRLLMLAATKVMGGGLPLGLNLATVKYWLDRCQAEVTAGRIRYLRFHLRRA